MRALFIVFAMAALAVLPAAAQQQKAQSGSTRSAAAKSAVSPSSPININSATQAQFEALPGIGPKVAQRIVEYRQKNGQFKKVEEILENARSCRDLLGISNRSGPRPVSRHRQKSQQISQLIVNGGRPGGRSRRAIEPEGCRSC